DEKGRMWAVEAYDYPNSHVMNKPGRDRIKILQDTDGDGKADKISVFAEGLTICTSVLPFGSGCITTDGEEMVFLYDSNNDGKADKRQVLFKGLKIWDTHACTSNLRYGHDGWIYATVGYSGVDIKIGEKHIKSGQGVLRFKPDGSDVEMLQNTTNNTWGLGITEEGRVMGSTANNNPSWWLDVPLAAYRKAGVKPQRTPRADSSDLTYPLTYDYLQVDCKERVTAGAGHAIYTSRLFPSEWWNKRALICAPTCKLVAAPRVERRGAGFKTTGFEQNIYATADSWSAPVAAEVGPDGGIYIADWYNSIVQHNVYGDK
ncbi:MAG: PVC-type heme-binding CxxCH protein, partial [Akkermansiaceae bacterium]